MILPDPVELFFLPRMAMLFKAEMQPDPTVPRSILHNFLSSLQLPGKEGIWVHFISVFRLERVVKEIDCILDALSVLPDKQRELLSNKLQLMPGLPPSIITPRSRSSFQAEGSVTQTS